MLTFDFKPENDHESNARSDILRMATPCPPEGLSEFCLIFRHLFCRT